MERVLYSEATMQASDVIAAISLIVSLVAAGFAWWSALEAKKARKISQSGELAPHFINVGYLWKFVQDKGGLGKDEIETGNRSIEFLRAQLSSDQEFQGCIQNLSGWVDDVPRFLMMFVGGQDISPPVYSQDDKIPMAQVNAARAVFDRKQHQYINIG